MSRNSRKKRKSRNQVARSKASFPTQRRAWQSLVDSGINPHRLTKPMHTGTYWCWELAP